MPLIDSKLHALAVLGMAPEPSGGLKGFCLTTYDNLVALLGQPHTHCSDKTTVEWAFRCNDGSTFHVYDYKEPATPKSPYQWHIGGSNYHSLAAFHRFTGLPVEALDPDAYMTSYVWMSSIFPSDAHQQDAGAKAQGELA